MIPLVTVLARPKGEPIATTDSPTLIREESPTVTAVSYTHLTLPTKA